MIDLKHNPQNNDNLCKQANKKSKVVNLLYT